MAQPHRSPLAQLQALVADDDCQPVKRRSPVCDRAERPAQRTRYEAGIGRKILCNANVYENGAVRTTNQAASFSTEIELGEGMRARPC